MPDLDETLAKIRLILADAPIEIIALIENEVTAFDDAWEARYDSSQDYYSCCCGECN